MSGRHQGGGSGTVPVDYPDPVVSDDCPGVAPAICSPPPGFSFPVGDTTVVCTATDASGNSNSCEFTVTVVETDACGSVSACEAAVRDAIPEDDTEDSKEAKKKNKSLKALRKFADKKISGLLAKAEAAAVAKKKLKLYRKLRDKILDKFVLKVRKFDDKGRLPDPQLTLTLLEAAVDGLRVVISDRLAELEAAGE